LKTFKDINGKEWTVTINTNALHRSKDLAKFDLLTIADDPKIIGALGNDPEKLVAVLYAICKPQADSAGITPEQFAEALGAGHVIDHATDALLEDLFSFFPKHRREPLMKAYQKLKQLQGKAAELAIQRLESPELTTQVEKMLAKAINADLPGGGG
jgi:hypothetical protein